jgi:Zn-dependent metalloprotease
LTWRVDVTGTNPDGSPAGEYVFVHARSGKILTHWPSIQTDTGSGTGLFVGTVPLDTTLSGGSYRMIDPVRGNNETHNGSYASGAPVFTDADNVWGTGNNSNAQTAAVDAHYGIAKTWDFYLSTYGRNGIANNGVGAKSYVHDGAYVNASWSDACFCMKYGDGDGTTYLPLVELDVAGHEMTHGVTSRSANLTYRAESGGLNEATSDIMGTMVEFYAANASDVPDYVIGEEIFVNYNPAINYIRRMDKPSSDGASQDCWSTRTKRVDVHYSSGPANHFFYLLSEGSGAKTINGIAHNSPTCNGSTLTGIGRAAAGAIWYRALTVYMTSSTNYAGARVATVNAATDLYGATSTQVAAVKAAWSAVSVA